MKMIPFILGALLSLSSYAYVPLNNSSSSCTTELQKSLNENITKLNNEYRLKDSFIKLHNEPEYLEGTDKNKAIILIHGFIASPFEIKSVARALNDVGYTVYMPLLYGFGAYGQMANEGKLPIWKKQVKAAVKSMSLCFQKITLGGISLGVALATDYVLNTKDTNITSLILLSPYFDISQSVVKLLLGPLSSAKSSIDLSTLYSLSRSDDLVEIISNPKYYSDIMPIITLQELLRFSDELLARPVEDKSDVPVLVAYSEFDSTINLKEAVTLPQEHFRHVQTYAIPEALKVPHQMGYESSNPLFDDMVFKILRFIDKSGQE